MYKQKEPNNKIAWILATGTVIGATALQGTSGMGLSLLFGIAGTVGTTVAANNRSTAFALGTVIGTGIGIVTAEQLPSWDDVKILMSKPKNTLVLPKAIDQTAKYPTYKFETI